MTTTLIIPENRTPHKFPLLARRRSSGCVVLFESTTGGTIVYQDKAFGTPGSRTTVPEGELDDRDIWQILPAGTKVEITQDGL